MSVHNLLGSGQARSLKLHELPRDEVFVRATPEVCFQVVASAGRVIERRSDGERLIEFESTVNGKRIVTKELVRAHEPDRIDYRWVEGPLPAVEETIFVARADDGATLTYEGRFAIEALWLLRPFARRWVARTFSRTVHEHLLEAKEIAERRASRRHVYPRDDGTAPGSLDS